MNIKLFKSIGITAIILVISMALITGCSKDKTTSPDDGGDNGGNNPPSLPNLVVINNFAFTPQTLTISVGDTVSWRNDQGVGHTVTSVSGNTMDSGVLTQGQTYQVVFTQAGTYPYYCTIHPSMTGVITVE
jgi:plastocyanin